MKKNMLDLILSCTDPSIDQAVREIQAKHRMKFAEFWNIRKGDRILEIGCGLGRTTAVLAVFVGDDGVVCAVDSAAADFGDTTTVGAATQRLKNSPLGKPLLFHLDADLLALDVDFPPKAFDTAVISHASRYFQSRQALVETLRRVGKWSRKLCIAEWDPRPVDSAQTPHLLALLFQVQCLALGMGDATERRTFITPEEWREIVEEIGGSIVRETSILSDALPDGEWDVDKAIALLQSDTEASNALPQSMRDLLTSQVALLEAARHKGRIKPLSSYCMVADV